MIYSITLQKKQKFGRPKKVTLREYSKRRLEANVMQKLKEGYTKTASEKKDIVETAGASAATAGVLQTTNVIKKKRAIKKAPKTIEEARRVLEKAMAGASKGDVIFTSNPKGLTPDYRPLHPIMILDKRKKKLGDVYPSTVNGVNSNVMSGVKSPHHIESTKSKLDFYLTGAGYGKAEYKPEHFLQFKSIKKGNPEAAKRFVEQARSGEYSYGIGSPKNPKKITCVDAICKAIHGKKSIKHSTPRALSKSLKTVWKNPAAYKALPVVAPAVAVGGTVAAYKAFKARNKKVSTQNKAVIAAGAIGTVPAVHAGTSLVKGFSRTGLKQLMKIAAKKKEDNNKAKASVLAGTAVAAPTAVAADHLTRKRNRVKIDPKAKDAIIFTEGGKYNTGGSGHAAASEAIRQAYEKKHPGAKAHVMNYGDYAKAKRLANPAKTNYEAMAGISTQNPFKKFLGRLGFGSTYLPFYASVSKRKLSKDIKAINPGRVIVTHPGAAPHLQSLGISPEVVVTDYGVGNKGSKDFWETAKGLGKKDPKNVGGVFAPSKSGTDIFKDVKDAGRPVTQISSIPIENRHIKPVKVDKKLVRKIKPTASPDFDAYTPDRKKSGKIVVPKGKKLVVLAGGGTGQDVEAMAEILLKEKRKGIHYVGVAGGNKKVYRRLQQLQQQHGADKISITGFAKNLDKLNEAAHVTVSRPHGLGPTELGASGKVNINVVRGRKYDKRKKSLKFVDSYSPHMSENALHYRDTAGSPIATLRRGKGRKGLDYNSLNDQLNYALSDHKNLSAKAKSWQETFQEGGGAAEVAAAKSSTFSRKLKLSKSKVGIAVGVSTASLLGAKHFLTKDKKKQVKVAEMKKKKKETGTLVSSTVKMTAAGATAGAGKYITDLIRLGQPGDTAGQGFSERAILKGVSEQAIKDSLRMRSKGGIRDSFSVALHGEEIAKKVRETANARIFSKGVLKSMKAPAVAAGLAGLGFGVHREFKRKQKK